MNMEGKRQVLETGNETVGDVVVHGKPTQKRMLSVILGVALVLMVAVIAGVAALGDSGRKLQEQLDLGAKYLEEMDYEQALVAFNAVLSIDPKNADAYLGIVEVYIRTNEFESALEYAREGYGVTGDERLKEKIDMIESGNIFASNGWTMKMSGYDGEGKLVFWHEFTYNLKGQRASVAKYNAQGVQEQYLELAYDEEGRELIGYGYEVLDGNLSKCVTEYSGNNYRVSSYIGTSDEVNCYADVVVDSEGKELKRTFYNSDGSIVGTAVSEYDAKGNLEKYASYDGNNELTGYSIHTYSEGGNWLQTQYYDNNNNLISYSEAVYDDNGNYIGDRAYDADGVLQYEHIWQ